MPNNRFTPKDAVAILVILILAIFKLTGHNGSLDVAVAIIIGYYFARRDKADVVIDRRA